ncbi:MAG: methyltransferase domain-containing protein [Bacteroidales bacterium]|nr:methyltransferase domain-containing protein [Bacteroidales bacterium]
MRDTYFKIYPWINNFKCLEIAPLNRPLLPKGHPNSRYLDLFSADELKAHFLNDPNIINDDIVDVHYIHKGQPYKELVCGEVFKLIIASHVIEHVPNLINWLNDIESILDDNGILQLAIPDKRYCFDFRRRLTDISDVMGAYLENREKPAPGIVYEHFLYVPNDICNDPVKHHNGEVSQEFNITKQYHDVALHFAKESLHKYIDTHCWVWTPESFIKIMSILYDNNLIKLKVVEEETVLTKVNTYEFYITMKK